MRRSKDFLARGATVAMLAASFVGLSAVAGAAGAVKETDATCVQATALLDGSRDGDHAKRWAAIISVVEKDERFKIVDEPERMVASKVAFKQWDVINPKEGAPTTMYAAHCGHGGTCNDVAQLVHKHYPEMTHAPVVHCGDVSNILQNPSPAPR